MTSHVREPRPAAGEAPYIIPTEAWDEERIRQSVRLVMSMDKAWTDWWNSLGHVARSNRDCGRYREAFEAGYLAALEQGQRAGVDAHKDSAHRVAMDFKLAARGKP